MPRNGTHKPPRCRQFVGEEMHGRSRTDAAARRPSEAGGRHKVFEPFAAGVDPIAGAAAKRGAQRVIRLLVVAPACNGNSPANAVAGVVRVALEVMRPAPRRRGRTGAFRARLWLLSLSWCCIFCKYINFL